MKTSFLFLPPLSKFQQGFPYHPMRTIAHGLPLENLSCKNDRIIVKINFQPWLSLKRCAPCPTRPGGERKHKFPFFRCFSPTQPPGGSPLDRAVKNKKCHAGPMTYTALKKAITFHAHNHPSWRCRVKIPTTKKPLPKPGNAKSLHCGLKKGIILPMRCGLLKGRCVGVYPTCAGFQRLLPL